MQSYLARCLALTALTVPLAWAAPPTIGGCQVFPANNVWNVPIDTLPVHPNSATYVNTIGGTKNLHPDFGTTLEYGIPFVIVPGTQPKVPINFTEAGDESDPGPYPIPSNAPIEGGVNGTGDRHVIALDRDNCKLYELYLSYQTSPNVWEAYAGSIFSLNSNASRPAGWTSADAAGLPILPGLVRYDEVNAGEITHALRFTVPQTKREYVWPARHYASSLTGTQYPPMGLRFRLKASFPETKSPPYSPHALTIIRALKKYGMILADNGSAWFLNGTSDPRWNDDQLNELKAIQGSWFEAVDTSSLIVNPDTAEAKVALTVSGGVSLSGAALSGVSFCAPAGVTCNTTDASGQFSCTVPAGFSGRIYPRLANTIFTPALRYSNVTTAQASQTLSARQPSTCVMDADNNGGVKASSDALLALRWMLGMSGTNATQGALGTGALRTDATAIATHLTAQKLDIDGDSSVDAATDGLLLLRSLLGFSGTMVTQGAISSCATRTTWAAIREHLATTCALSVAP